MALDIADDVEIVGLIAAGDGMAVSRLYDRYGGLAFGLAYRILGDRGSAEEVVQEAFVAVWRSAGSYHPDRGSTRSWLLRIVRNRSIDALRKAKARPQMIPDERALDGPSASGVDEVVMRRAESGAVRRALLSLSPEQRQTIELAYFGGYTQSEIAGMLDLPLGTVKGRTRLGLRSLHRLLSPVR